MKPINNPFKACICAALILSIGSESCFNYYRVAKRSNINVVTNSAANANPPRYFILRAGANAYCMTNIVLSDDKKSLSCTLEDLPDEHKLHLHKGRGGHMRYKSEEPEAVVLNEVHVFVSQGITAVAGKDYALPFNNVLKVEVLEKDKGRSTVSHLLGALIVTGGTILVAGIIIGGKVQHENIVIPID